FCAAIFVCSFLYFLFLLIKGPKRRVAMVLAGIVWVCLVAASRLYLRAHFASDVTGSMLFAGAFWLLIWSVKPVFDVCLAKILPKSILKGM
ncbi:MAG TPA: hypothetical protein DEP42_01725, partial [Ruminococcaceae bacterium]|nr:hypothetical protein [Oscillospiraceae bacterium]